MTLGWRQLEGVLSEGVAPVPQKGKPLGTTRAVLERVSLVEPVLRYTRPSPQLDALLGIDLSGAGADVSAAAAGAPPAGEAPPPAPLPLPAPTPVAAAAPSDPAAPGPLELEIEALDVAKGEVEALDKTVTPAARTRVRGLSLRARDVRWPASTVADVRLRATLPAAARLDVHGALRAGRVGDFQLTLRRLDLPVFNPYAGAAAGVTVDRGAASVDATLALRGRRMELENELVLHGLAVSLRDPETFERSFGVPLDLALALLRDPAGDIALGIPVSVGDEGAAIGLGAVLASALRAALLGALMSPLKLAGAAFGGGDDGAEGGVAIEPLPSAPGAAELAADAATHLDGLAKLLRERPSVALALRGRAGAADRPFLAEQLLVERAQRGEGLPPLEHAGFLPRRRIADALERRARGEAPALAAEDQLLYDRYVAATPVPDDRLAALAAVRAEQARAALVAKGVPAERLPLGDPETDAEPGVVLGFEAIAPPDAPAD